MSASCGASCPPMPPDIRKCWRAEWVMEAWSEVRKKVQARGYCSSFGALWGVDMSGKRKRRNELFLRERVTGVNQTQPHAVDARL